ncbi:MAG: hypothetical protein ABI939_03625 [Anaerolineaceae bacterium]
MLEQGEQRANANATIRYLNCRQKSHVSRHCDASPDAAADC